MQYETTVVSLTTLDLAWRLEILASLDRTIDALFAELERRGEESLLQTLCPYFGRIWPAGLTLATWMAAQDPARLRGARVLELGCGLALPSLVASRRGAVVTATDAHPEVPRFLARNLAANGLSGQVRYLGVDWRLTATDGGEHQPLPEALSGPWDWIIGSDILYEPDHSTLLAGLIPRLSGPETRVVITDQGRAWLGDFVTAIESRGFQVRRTAEPAPQPLDSHDTMHAHRIASIHRLELAPPETPAGQK